MRTIDFVVACALCAAIPAFLWGVHAKTLETENNRLREQIRVLEQHRGTPCGITVACG